MGSVHEFSQPNRVPSRAVFGFATRLVERDAPRGRRAIVEIDGVATFCVVAEMPAVGDVIHGDLTAIVEKVRVTRKGQVRILARRVVEPEPVAGHSLSVDVVLREMRRRR